MFLLAWILQSPMVSDRHIWTKLCGHQVERQLVRLSEVRKVFGLRGRGQQAKTTLATVGGSRDSSRI